MSRSSVLPIGVTVAVFLISWLALSVIKSENDGSGTNPEVVSCILDEGQRNIAQGITDYETECYGVPQYAEHPFPYALIAAAIAGMATRLYVFMRRVEASRE